MSAAGTRLLATVCLGSLLVYHAGAAQAEGLAWGKYTHNLPTGLFATNDLIAPSGLSNIVAISSGLQHAAFLNSDGRVQVAGEWAWQQTNVPANLSCVVEIAAGEYHTLARTFNGAVRAWGANYNGQCQVPASVSNSVLIAAGGFHSLGLSSNGTLIGWGDNRSGQCNPPAGLSNVVALAAGTFHSLALKSNGRVVAWGNNSGGQTNVPAGLSNVVAIAARNYFSLALRRDGTVVGWGTNSAKQLNIPAGLTDVKQIAAGDRHVIALRNSGQVIAWGGNTGGQTNVPAAATNCTAVAAGSLHSVVVLGGAAPAFISTPQPMTLLPGGSGLLAGLALGTEPLTYQWQLAGTNLSNGTRSQLTITNAGARHAGDYTLQVSNAWGSVRAEASVLVIGTPPAITCAPTDTSGVIGTPAELTVEATGTLPLAYQWTRNGADLAGATGSQLSFTSLALEDAGSYSVRVANDYGVTASAEVTLEVTLYGITPAFTLTPTNTSVIIGSTVTLAAAVHGSAPLAWQWYHNGNARAGATRAYYSITQAGANDGGNYHVTVANQYGAATSPVAALTAIGLPPTISTQPAGVTTTVSNTVSLSVEAQGTAPLLYQWQRFGANLAGATVSSLSLVNAQTNQSGDYRVCLQNAYGSVTSAVAVVLIEKPNPPVIVTQPASQTHFVGTNIALTVAAAGEAPLGYQWKFNGAVVNGATDSSYLFAVAETNHSGGYIVMVSNRWGTTASKIAVLTVTYPPEPPIITSTLQSQAILLGASPALAVTTTGTAPLSYQWRRNGLPLADSSHLSGASTRQLRILSFGPADVGSYAVTVTNAAGADATAPITLSLAPTNTFEGAFLGEDTNTMGNWKGVYGSSGYIVIGDHTNLPPGVSVTAGGATNALWADTAVVQALSKATSSNLNDRIAANWNNLTNLFFDLIVDRPYELSVYSMDWNSLGASQRMDILPTPTSAPLCSATVSNFAMGKYLRFRVAGSVRVNVTTLRAMSVMISGIFLDAVGAPVITRQPSSCTNVAGTPATFEVLAEGQNPLSYQWQFNESPVAGATGASLELAQVEAADQGDYRVVVSNPYGSVTSVVATLTVVSPPSLTSQPAGSTVIRGQTATLNVAVAGTQPLAYTWWKNGELVPGAETPALEMRNAQLGDSGDYLVVVTNAYGAVTSETARVDVVIPANILVQPASQSVEAGQTAALVAEVEGTEPLHRHWLRNGQLMPGATADALSIADSTEADSGDYVLVVTNAYGGATSQVARVLVTLPPNVPPIAQNDQLLKPGVGARIIEAAELLANDTDPDGGTITVAEVSATTARGGTANLQGTTITYTPASPDHLWDSFDYRIHDQRGGSASARAMLQLDGNGNGSLATVIGVSATGDGKELRLTFVGLPDTIYQIEAAEDPAGPWNVVATRTADAQGEFTFADPAVASQPSRFYRTVRQ